MTALLLAATSALVYGSADYCGGTAARRTSAVTVTVLSQVITLPLIVAAAVLVGGTPRFAGMAWGAVAGAAGLVGLVLLYRGLSRGAMSVVAPSTAVTAALVPLVAGLFLEKWPPPLALVGAGCAVVAIALVSLVSSGERTVVTPALLASAIAAGVAFGLFFIAFDRVGSGAGMWPVASARLTSVALGLLIATGTAALRRPAQGAWPWIIGAGVLDITANGLYVLAAQRGALAIVAPVTSLYPVSTVLLALILDRERVRPLQMVGLGLAATALVLVSGTV